MSSLPRVHNSESLFLSVKMSVIHFCLEFCCYPYRGVCYSRVSARQEGDDFSAKTLCKLKFYFIIKMTSPAKVQPASSDFWKVPRVSG